jgi:hypothetical protein
MDVRISRISPIGTDFFEPQCRVSSKKNKKSVPIGEIREIRTSIRIVIFQSEIADVIRVSIWVKQDIQFIYSLGFIFYDKSIF